MSLPTEHELEARFTEFVRNFGGEHVADLLPEKSNRPVNADYFLSGRSVVAELKTITVDHMSDPSIGERTKTLLDQWISNGLVGPESFDGHFINTQGMQPKYVLEMLDVLFGSFKSALSTASKQIRATKAHFQVPDAKGLLVFANIADRRLVPDIAFQMLVRALRLHSRSIHSFVFFSPALDFALPGVSPSLWMCGDTVIGRAGVDPKLLSALGEAWHDFNA